MPVNQLVQLRRGTASQWTSANPTLSAGEIGVETDTKKIKAGDGSTAWNSLSYVGGSGGGLAWQSTQTTGFTAVAGRAYPCNTTSAAFTVTLPASPSAGDLVTLTDYAGTWGTNNLTVNPNGNKINGNTGNVVVSVSRASVNIVYLDSTQGWVSYANVSTDLLAQPAATSIDYLVVAGGGGAGGGGSTYACTGGGGAGGVKDGSSVSVASVASLTITVGGPGSGGSGYSGPGTVGGNSQISGTGFTTVSCTGGGASNSYNTASTSKNGGSGAGGNGLTTVANGATGGTGTSGEGNAGGDGRNFADTTAAAGGGGGKGVAGATYPSNGVGGNGGTGYEWPTSSGTFYAGGGGGGANTTGGSGGSSIGGTGGSGNTNGTNASPANRGSGGGGAGGAGSGGATNGGNGSGGVVIIRYADTFRAATTTGSPSVTTSGGYRTYTWTGNGSITF